MLQIVLQIASGTSVCVQVYTQCSVDASIGPVHAKRGTLFSYMGSIDSVVGVNVRDMIVCRQCIWIMTGACREAVHQLINSDLHFSAFFFPPEMCVLN